MSKIDSLVEFNDDNQEVVKEVFKLTQAYDELIIDDNSEIKDALKKIILGFYQLNKEESLSMDNYLDGVVDEDTEHNLKPYYELMKYFLVHFSQNTDEIINLYTEDLKNSIVQPKLLDANPELKKFLELLTDKNDSEESEVLIKDMENVKSFDA